MDKEKEKEKVRMEKERLKADFAAEEKRAKELMEREIKMIEEETKREIENETNYLHNCLDISIVKLRRKTEHDIEKMTKEAYKDLGLMEEIAEKNDIPFQLEVLPRGGTDGGAFQRAAEGSITCTISIPSRYVHTTNEMCAKSDIQASVDLLAQFLREAGSRDYSYDLD